MPALRLHAEQLRLARLLGVAPDALRFLRELDASALAELHDASRAVLLARHRPLFRRVASASKLLPVALSAWIAEQALGPLLCARIAGELSVAGTLALCRHLPAPFMADVSLHMESSALLELAQHLPDATLQEITGTLLARGEYLILGELVDTLPIALIHRIATQFCSAEEVLRATQFVEQPLRLEALIGMLPGAEQQRLARLAADPGQGLMKAALSLLHRLPPGWQRRLLDTAVADGDATLEALVREVDRLGVWADALPLAALLDRAGKWKLLQLPLWREDALRSRALVHATRPGLMPYARSLFAALAPEERERALKALARAGQPRQS